MRQDATVNGYANHLFGERMSERHQLVLDFIKAYIRLHGVAPSYLVIAKGIGLKSKANIHRIVHKLEEEGHLVLRHSRFNSIKVMDRSVREMAAL
jgi:SOS-response transcriptional repressor LexA